MSVTEVKDPELGSVLAVQSPWSVTPVYERMDVKPTAEQVTC